MNLYKKINNLLLVILTMTPLLFLNLSFDYFYMSKITSLYLILSILLITWYLYDRDFIALNPKGFNVIIYLYGVLLLVSTIASYDILLSLWGEVYREEGFFTLSLYLILMAFSYKYSNINIKSIDLIIVSASLISIIGIFQYFDFNIISLFYPDFFSHSKVTSTIGNRNFLGSYLTLMLPLSSFLFLYLKKWYYLFATALIYLTLLMTLTRSAWLGSLVAFVLLIVLTKNKFTDKKSIIMLATTFFMVSVVFEIISGGDLILRFTAIGKDLGAMAVQSDDYATKSGLYRVFIAEHVIELIKERPLFGWGPDTLGLVFTDRYADKIISELGTLMIFDKAHNEYLQIAYASGIPALLVYLSLVFTVIKTSFKNLNNNPLMIPLLCGVIGYLVQAFFNISVVSVAYIYWIFLGALMHMATNEENNKVNI